MDTCKIATMDESAKRIILDGIYGDKSSKALCETIIANGLEGLIYFYLEVKNGKIDDKEGRFSDILRTCMINMTVTPLDGDGKLIISSIPEIQLIIKESI